MKRAPAPFITRRCFLRTSAAIAAASTLPRWFLEECEGGSATKPIGPNEQPAVALVGCGGMGRNDAKNASRFGRIVALCDVDEMRLADAKKQWPEAVIFNDFRKLMER